MASLTILLTFALNVMVSVGSKWPFQGHQYCKNAKWMWYMMRPTFNSTKESVKIDLVYWFGSSWSSRHSEYLFDNQTKWLTMKDTSIWKEGSWNWDPKWWSEFVYDEGYNAWNVGGSAGLEWFPSC
ncbi:hypothetical protein FOL47_004850 [Perkinsus chesapeaki]|uniref:Uncharacterized protein n=1 Tax=Perkinsus chesapeaki TaxID=330153 RepID=A0A7J6M0B1_PERCH|nr:hypothetical protein FOL47_004850 [Perkinsus chesapeaki]